jgi:hypothetical protein
MQALWSRHVSSGIEASQRARILSPPAKPPVLVLWLNQITGPVLTKSYEKAKLHEVAVYIARVMKKDQHKDSIKCAYNFE